MAMLCQLPELPDIPEICFTRIASFSSYQVECKQREERKKITDDVELFHSFRN